LIKFDRGIGIESEWVCRGGEVCLENSDMKSSTVQALVFCKFSSVISSPVFPTKREQQPIVTSPDSHIATSFYIRPSKKNYLK